MNYQNIYNKIIEYAKARGILGEYTETHHILPRSLGGTNEPYNLVELTAREHFIAHLLLARIFGGKMIHAAHMMSNMGRYSSRTYSTLRIKHAELVSKLMTGRVVSETTKIKQKQTIKRNTQERMDAGLSHQLAGIPKSETHKSAWKESRMAGAGWVCPESKKEKQRKTMTGEGNHMWGKTHSNEAKKIISEANKQQTTCPHCGTSGAISIMKRWHFENCKHSPIPVERKKYPKKVCPHCGKEGGGARMISNHFENCQKRLT